MRVSVCLSALAVLLQVQTPQATIAGLEVLLPGIGVASFVISIIGASLGVLGVNIALGKVPVDPFFEPKFRKKRSTKFEEVKED